MDTAHIRTMDTTYAPNQIVLESIMESAALKRAMFEDVTLISQIAEAGEILSNALGFGRRAYLMGNGGSASDAQHIAAELVGRYKMERRGLPVIALTTNTSCLTAIGNDYSYDVVFSRQVEALAEKGDVAIGISTSGNSRNVLLALEAARKNGGRTIALTGRSGGQLRGAAELCLCIPSEDTPRIQEAHILIGHILSEIVERKLFSGGQAH